MPLLLHNRTQPPSRRVLLPPPRLTAHLYGRSHVLVPGVSELATTISQMWEAIIAHPSLSDMQTPSYERLQTESTLCLRTIVHQALCAP